jgi:outer membrane protein assembly factor BamB
MKAFAAAATLVIAATAAAENWPAWRGPTRDGVSREENLPTRWGVDEHIRWKAPLAGLGTSTPIVWGDRVILTSQLGVGPLDRRGAEFPEAVAARDYAGGDDAVEFIVHAFGRDDGALVWAYRFGADEPTDDLPSVHPKHNLASPSVVTDGEHVYAWMGTGQLVALTMDGDLVWERHLGRDYGPFDVMWGHGSSPALYDGSVILLVDHPARAYMVALDAATGETRWTVDRGDGIRSYSTPLVLRRSAGDELIVNSSHRIESYDPLSGELLWHAGGRVTLAIAMPVEADGVLYASRGYSSGPYSAIRLGGRGDVNATHVKWHVGTRAPYISSLIHYGGLVFMATEMGIASAIDPSSGEPVWRERLGGAFTASPVAGDDKVYLTNESGETFVFEPGVPPALLARNTLEERTLASPAIANGTLYIRTDAHLFAIAEPTRR